MDGCGYFLLLSDGSAQLLVRTVAPKGGGFDPGHARSTSVLKIYCTSSKEQEYFATKNNVLANGIYLLAGLVYEAIKRHDTDNAGREACVPP